MWGPDLTGWWSFFLKKDLFISGCTGSLLLHAGFLSLQRMGFVDLRHVESSPNRDQNRVPCVGRRIPNH